LPVKCDVVKGTSMRSKRNQEPKSRNGKKSQNAKTRKKVPPYGIKPKKNGAKN